MAFRRYNALVIALALLNCFLVDSGKFVAFAASDKQEKAVHVPTLPTIEESPLESEFENATLEHVADSTTVKVEPKDEVKPAEAGTLPKEQETKETLKTDVPEKTVEVKEPETKKDEVPKPKKRVAPVRPSRPAPKPPVVASEEPKKERHTSSPSDSKKSQNLRTLPGRIVKKVGTYKKKLGEKLSTSERFNKIASRAAEIRTTATAKAKDATNKLATEVKEKSIVTGKAIKKQSAKAGKSIKEKSVVAAKTMKEKSVVAGKAIKDKSIALGKTIKEKAPAVKDRAKRFFGRSKDKDVESTRL